METKINICLSRQHGWGAVVPGTGHDLPVGQHFVEFHIQGWTCLCVTANSLEAILRHSNGISAVHIHFPYIIKAVLAHRPSLGSVDNNDAAVRILNGIVPLWTVISICVESDFSIPSVLNQRPQRLDFRLKWRHGLRKREADQRGQNYKTTHSLFLTKRQTHIE